MSHSFQINLDPRPLRELPERTRTLDIVLTPVDDFTGRTVPGVTAKISRQKVKARRSLSGHLFFERLFAEAQHLVEMDASKAGYFSPAPMPIPMPQVRVGPTDTFVDAADKAAKLAADTRIVRLIRRPDAVLDGEAMIVRGQVTRGGDPAEGVEVTGTLDGAASPVFRTLTNERGNFAIRLRPAEPDFDAGSVSVPVTASVRLLFDGGTPWTSPQPLEDLRSFLIPAPIAIP